MIDIPEFKITYTRLDDEGRDLEVFTRKFWEDHISNLDQIVFFIESCFPSLGEELENKYVLYGDEHVRRVVDVSSNCDKKKALENLRHLAGKLGYELKKKKGTK